MPTSGDPLRFGVLGAARISASAIVQPARSIGCRLVAVAARDRRRAEAFGAEAGIERVLDSYAAVVTDPEVEAVYNPLPNGLHGQWNRAAIRAGKHVLSEKPFAANAIEAALVAADVAAAGVTVVEGFHYLYHPTTKRLHELIESGELGELRHVEARMVIPSPPSSDPRWSLELAGGALMDLGCYSLHANRVMARFAGGEPTLVSVTGGESLEHPGVDEWVDAQMEFPSGITGRAYCHMAGSEREMSYRLVGTRGEATVTCFVLPHTDDRVLIHTEKGGRVEHLGTRSSYTYQLEAFSAALRGGPAMRTDLADAVSNMQIIDECYRAIGLESRMPTGSGETGR